ncbi:MAG: squalene/phytoene synthase family protein [Gammaproteobacteria bacterium]|nr:squalene/phytoene synthase family protein [Gammaproteobacteria bacterium]
MITTEGSEQAVGSLSEVQLRAVLKSVSRSFYLSIRVLSTPLQAPIALAYLLARAADTIADTRILPPSQRLHWLQRFRAVVANNANVSEIEAIIASLTPGQANVHERRLMHCLPQVLQYVEALPPADAQRVRQVVLTLCDGMFMDLEAFPDEQRGVIAALPNAAALEHYIYLVAGCVGEFWTEMLLAHEPALAGWDYERQCEQGVQFGKALQLTNVLRDAGTDLRNGRCYLPRDALQALGLKPEHLLAEDASLRARPVLRHWLRQALEYYDSAGVYVLAIPQHCLRLRLAAIWPLVIGMATLARLSVNPAWLKSESATKVPRRSVYAMLLLSIPLAFSNNLLSRWLLLLRKRVVVV